MESREPSTVRSTGTPGIIQVRSADCCCHAYIRMSGLCEVKHAHPWQTVAVKAGVDVVMMKRSHCDNFRMPPDMNPRKRYPVMEDTKMKKRKTTHNVRDFNVEDEDDIPLSKLQQKEISTRSEQIEVKTMTENILPGSVTRNNQVSALKRKTGSKLYEDVLEKNGREQKIIVWSKRMEMRWQGYHRIISHPKHYRALEMEICKLNVPAIQSTLVINHYLSGVVVDRIALSFLPEDAPEGLVPIVCASDGNCFCRAISHLIYGNEDHHMEIRVQIVIEAVRRKPLHLNNTFLRLGQSPTSPERSLSEMYSIYSQCYRNGKPFEEIYNDKVLTICQDEAYMGLWQIHQVANLL